MDLFRKRVPAWPLSECVQVLWYNEGVRRPHEFERIMPDGSVELVINLREDRFRVYEGARGTYSHDVRGYLISGPRSEYFVIDTEQQRSTMGVHFKPGGAFQFLGMPLAEVRNLQVGLDELWGGAAAAMRDRLLEARTVAARFDVLEKCLLQRASGWDRHPAVGFALQEFCDGASGRNVADVTAEIGLSDRHFIQLFQKEVGLTPKLFRRVRRFQRVLRAVSCGKPVNWADAALSCGYFDQPHFIHDFKAFSGFSPSTYLALRTEHLNHVPLELAVS